MAQDKKPAKKKQTSQSKPKAKAQAKSRAAKPVAPPKPQYSDVLSARLTMNDAYDEVLVAVRHLNRAKSNYTDFQTRADGISEATDELAAARVASSEAVTNFKKVKAAAK